MPVATYTVTYDINGSGSYTATMTVSVAGTGTFTVSGLASGSQTVNIIGLSTGSGTTLINTGFSSGAAGYTTTVTVLALPTVAAIGGGAVSYTHLTLPTIYSV